MQPIGRTFVFFSHWHVPPYTKCPKNRIFCFQVRHHLQKERASHSPDPHGEGEAAAAGASSLRSEWELEVEDPDVGNLDDQEAVYVEAQQAVDTYRVAMAPRGSHATAKEWWKSHKGRFPAVEALARRRLCTQASSATSERAFSKAGRIVTKRRLTLTPRHVDELSLLAWNPEQ